MRYWIGVLWMKVFGWKMDLPPTMPPQFVYLCFPHTSNWDLPFMLAITWASRVRVKYLAKHTLFRGPFNTFFRALGAMPIDRRAPQGMVGQAADLFKADPGLRLGIPPEGTRKKVTYWKSGFYHIARAANVPVGLGSLDYHRKVGGYLGFVDLTGDIRADLDRIRAAYEGVLGENPELQSIPRMREEDETQEPSGTAR